MGEYHCALFALFQQQQTTTETPGKLTRNTLAVGDDMNIDFPQGGPTHVPCDSHICMAVEFDYKIVEAAVAPRPPAALLLPHLEDAPAFAPCSPAVAAPFRADFPRR